VFLAVVRFVTQLFDLTVLRRGKCLHQDNERFIFNQMFGFYKNSKTVNYIFGWRTR